MECEMGAETTGRQGPRQAGFAARLARAAAAPALIGALMGALAGCSGVPGFVHRTEGGEIAKTRPEPPGLGQPFPNLASVPSRPAAPDQAALERLSQSLIADRENARHLTVAAAPPDPSLPAASPQLFGLGTAPPPVPAAAAAATLEAVQGPAASAMPPTVATPAAVASRPQEGTPAPVVIPTVPAPRVPAGPPAAPQVAPLTPPAGPGGTPFPGSDYGGNPPGAANAAHSPAQPPFGANSAPAVPTGVAPTPPSSLPGRVPPPAPPTLPADPTITVDVPFPPASAVLPAASADALHALARRRGAHAVAVVGHGDATGSDPDAQSRAVALGLQRAEAIAQALAAAGVPDTAVRLDAQAGGRGGSARILE